MCRVSEEPHTCLDASTEAWTAEWFLHSRWNHHKKNAHWLGHLVYLVFVPIEASFVARKEHARCSHPAIVGCLSAEVSGNI